MCSLDHLAGGRPCELRGQLQASRVVEAEVYEVPFVNGLVAASHHIGEPTGLGLHLVEGDGVNLSFGRWVEVDLRGHAALPLTRAFERFDSSARMSLS